MSRAIPVLAAALAAMTANAPALADDALSEMQACRSLSDAARLACFDRVLARHDSAPAASVAAVPPVAASPSFGSERLPETGRPQQVETMAATVAAVSFNTFKHFTVTLDNGQVWRQIDADTPVARLKTADAVKISRGFLDSYTLSVEGVWGSYKVKRIK